jgi:demethylsterigmatocystin 6-O-methyltransferase
MALAKIGVDLQIFNTLKKSEKPLTLTQLAEKSGAAPELLGTKIGIFGYISLMTAVRILRTQAAFNLIKETGKDEFAANRLTSILADENVSGAIEQL